ncbi:MAG: UDP-N-acetylglucosamine 1-carboxyvinyltransferase [bacterium]
MQDSYIIHGGKPLKGQVTLSGAKNASIKLMIASLLFDTPVVLHRVPANEDNQHLRDLFADLGVSVSYENGTVTIDPRTIHKSEVSLYHGSLIRSSFLLFGPLLHRFGRTRIPNPGGCRIGARPIDRITDGLTAIGMDITYHSETGYYDASARQISDAEYTFAKSSHTGTEALLLYAVKRTGTTTIHHAALEPEIDDLISFLNDGGAQITREGTDLLIRGVSSLKQSHPHTVLVDRNEAVTFAALAYATRGDITLTNIDPSLIATFTQKLSEAGAHVELVDEHTMRFIGDRRLKATDIQTAPHPGYMTDWQPQWGLMMSTAEGVSEIHETLLESRLNYVQELQKVGAKMELFQPEVANPLELYQFNYDPAGSYKQAVRITGVDRLHNGVMQIHDIRAGAVVVMAALSAEGESVIYGAAQVERGYENLVEKITSLGGSIQKI